MRTPIIALASTLLLTIAACSDDTTDSEATVENEATATAEPSTHSPSPTRTKTPRPTPTPTPEPETVPTHAIGDPITFTTAKITVTAAEATEEIARDYDGPIVPAEGESLHLITMEWTNLDNQAVEKKCWGPYTIDMRVYDTQDREMLLNNDSGGIVGNDCSNGLLTGQTGPWLAAYQGLEGATIGYITFEEGWGSNPEVVLVDETLTLTYE